MCALKNKNNMLLGELLLYLKGKEREYLLKHMWNF